MKDFTETGASSYCNYDEAFTSYDQVRQPNGLRELLQLFAQTKIPLEEQQVLEGGFGTGVYIEFIRHHVKAVYGVEGSDEGYRQAVRKMSDATNVHLRVGTILRLSFPDEFFHAYMVNQVVHHLDSDPTFPHLNVFLREGKRVLAPGGVLTINTSSHEQLDPYSGVYWHYAYIEKAARALKARVVPLKELVLRLEALRFTDIKMTIPSGHLFHTRYYEDPSIALEAAFRKGDSVYCFLSYEEIEESNVRIRSAIEDGSVYEEMRRAATRAAEIGEAIIVSARKAD
jgi:ubiquinone/menaquinone biosynthesis C-methylase UbiE